MRAKGITREQEEKDIGKYLETVDSKGVEDFVRLMESGEADDVAKAARSSTSRKIRAMSLLARGMKDKEIVALLGISKTTLATYKKDAAVRAGVTSIQAKIAQKTELIVDSVSERRIEVASEAQEVLRQIMHGVDKDGNELYSGNDKDGNPIPIKVETRLKAASYLVEPLTRYYAQGTQTQTMSFQGSDPTILLDDLAEIKAIFCRKKLNPSDE